MTDFLGGSDRGACYNYINTWGNIILGNYYIPHLVVFFIFIFSVFFRGCYPILARIWFIIVIANRGYIYIYYKLPQLLVIPVIIVILLNEKNAI
jgi:hypothetical protein